MARDTPQDLGPDRQGWGVVSEFGLILEALLERLDRIENLLGITDPTPAQAAMERLAQDQEAGK